MLVITGQQLGYLEPCGCTGGQTGGLGRREALLDELQGEGLPLLPVDLGSLIEDPATSRGGADQVRIKLGIALKALQQLGYKALALSADDLKLGVGDFFGQYLNTPDAPALLAANVEPAEGLKGVVKPKLVHQAGHWKYGITAVIEPSSLQALADDELPVFLASISPPAEALAQVFPELEKSSDVQVLLVQGSEDLAKQLAGAFPGFDVVVSLCRFVDPPVQHEKLNDGKTLLIQIGQKGQNVGLIGAFDYGNRPLRYRRERLGPEFEPGEAMTKLVSEVYTQALAKADVLGTFPRFPHPSGARYVGVDTCKKCHPKTVEFWSNTRHAHAWEGVLHGPRGDRRADAECVSCHSTGFTYESGFIDETRTPFLKGQQCENCHGPGSNHASAPDNTDFRKQIALTADYADRSGLCVRCHDADNDPHYDFQVRWSAVAHKNLDTYASPRVHQGLDVEKILKALSRPGTDPVDTD